MPNTRGELLDFNSDVKQKAGLIRAGYMAAEEFLNRGLFSKAV